jgi:hypothetical protein
MGNNNLKAYCGNSRPFTKLWAICTQNWVHTSVCE